MLFLISSEFLQNGANMYVKCIPFQIFRAVSHANLFRPIKIGQTIKVASRNYRLTPNEISAGLKPLVIRIHPDLFAAYPDIQDVNSTSLSSKVKIILEYITMYVLQRELSLYKSQFLGRSGQ